MSSRTPGSECVVCGCSLDGIALTSHCTRCLLELGLNPEQPAISFSPRTFAGYELVEQLGRGGMGVVYRARHVTTDRIVALKMLLHSQQDSPIAVLRFQIEGEAAARLSHPNIVRILEIGEHDEQCFISMQLIQGASVQERVERGEYRFANVEPSTAAARQWQTRIVELLLSVARAVEYAHTRGVLHRDLKPANILIDESGIPFLTDFGLAKLTDSDLRPSETNASLGTPVYMSPEQTRGEPLNVTTDVYSLGVILYELLAGQLPFRAQTALELAREISRREPLPPRRLNSSIDRGLQTICLKCLDKDPLRRYATAGLLGDDLQRWRRGQRVLARPVGSLRRSVRWTRNNPVGTALIGSLFAVIVALLSAGYNFVQWQRAEGESAEERRLREIGKIVIWQATGLPAFWTRPDDPGVTISSEILHWAAGMHRREPLDPSMKRCSIGMVVEEKDAKDGLASYANLVHYLEGKITDSTKTTRFDICAFRRKKSAMEALGRGDIDMLKIGGASFVVADRNYPGIKPVVGQYPAKTGAIFVRSESGIDSLEKLQGKRIALGNTSSTVSMWAIYLLAQSGVAPGESLWTSEDGAVNDGKGSKNSNEDPIEAVLSGECEAGAINQTILVKHPRNTELRVVEKYESFPVLWLARSELPIEIVEAVGNALTELRDPAIFEGLSDKVKIYKRVSAEETAVLHEVVTAVESVMGGPLR
jgi:serine/threonine protein kinase/ABC-type phosphate/phosphonate transport system substrate-binding protein